MAPIGTFHALGEGNVQLLVMYFVRGAGRLQQNHGAAVLCQVSNVLATRQTMIGPISLVLWFAMLALQGEGMELDVERRRHPMWEWLFSHPVGARAVFLGFVI